MRQIEVILVAVVLASIFSIASASDTTTKFQTGPFSVSVDLGVPCNDVNISKPVSGETLGGVGYIDYDVHTSCGVGVEIWIRQLNKDTFDLSSAFGTSSINDALIRSGASTDTIHLFSRTIDGKQGAAGSGYLSKYSETLDIGAFYISPKSYCYVYVYDNETMAVSALKTIHVTEAV